MDDSTKDIRKATLDTSHYFAQKNEFITAIYDKRLTVLGQKLIRLGIAEADSKKDERFYAYRIELVELARALKLTPAEEKNIYRDVKKAVRYMATMAIGIEKNNKKGSYRYIPLFRRLEYHDDEGWLELLFNEEMTPFFLQLQGQFTQIPVVSILFMNHKYSIRIYELIQSRLFNAERIEDGVKTTMTGIELPLYHYVLDLDIEDIRKVITEYDEKGRPVKERYKQIGELKRYVMDPTIKDINEQGMHRIEYEDIRNGRRVTGFRMKIWTKATWGVMENQKKAGLNEQYTIFEQPGFAESEDNPFFIMNGSKDGEA